MTDPEVYRRLGELERDMTACRGEIRAVRDAVRDSAVKIDQVLAAMVGDTSGRVGMLSRQSQSEERLTRVEERLDELVEVESHRWSPAKRYAATGTLIATIITALGVAGARLQFGAGSDVDIDEARRAKLEAGERIVEAYRDAGEVVGLE